jgi:DNA (cytosine-5)-methyltransferase 1
MTDGGKRMRVAALFAGIAGIEEGLHRAGHETVLFCEIDAGAQAVLRHHYPDLPLVGDVRALDRLPTVDLVAAGFPCTDLSQAGRTAGITGANSGLVGEVFRLVTASPSHPRWLVLENVPFMLQLDRGRAMHFLTETLSKAGFRWAYRVVDTLAFGLPQRRRRVLLLASRTEDPRNVLFAEDADAVDEVQKKGVACGFYWTEGLRGLGWAVDAVPTLKGGSTIGISSPPAIWIPWTRQIVTPDIRDAERLQGFDPDWTLPAVTEIGRRVGARWKLVGNAVSVPVAEWLGRRLLAPGKYDGTLDQTIGASDPWPYAAWGEPDGRVYRAPVTSWPIKIKRPHLTDFLRYPVTPLSARATAGFLSRAKVSRLRFAPGFIEDVAHHLEVVSAPKQLPLEVAVLAAG